MMKYSVRNADKAWKVKQRYIQKLKNEISTIHAYLRRAIGIEKDEVLALRKNIEALNDEINQVRSL